MKCVKPSAAIVLSLGRTKPATLSDDRPKVYMSREALRVSPPEVLREIKKTFQCDIMALEELDKELPAVGRPIDVPNVDDAFFLPKPPSISELFPPQDIARKTPRIKPKDNVKHEKTKRRQQKQGRKRNR